MGYATAIRGESIEAGSTELAGDKVIVGLIPGAKDPAAEAQIVYALTLPNVKRVSFGGGNPVGQEAFEAQTAAILVESPLPGEQVEPGFEVTGTANTFEATFGFGLVSAWEGAEQELRHRDIPGPRDSRDVFLHRSVRSRAAGGESCSSSSSFRRERVANRESESHSSSSNNERRR